jgi:hypothetical protein
MYDFSHLLQKPETHDVLFKTSHGHSAGFLKVLLLGLSEMWRTRAGGLSATAPTTGSSTALVTAAANAYPMFQLANHGISFITLGAVPTCDLDHIWFISS